MPCSGKGGIDLAISVVICSFFETALNGNWMKGASWSENGKQNKKLAASYICIFYFIVVSIFISLFCQYLYNYLGGAANLSSGHCHVHYLPVNDRNRLACDVINPFATCSSLFMYSNEADCWVQTGNTHICVFVTFSYSNVFFFLLFFFFFF